MKSIIKKIISFVMSLVIISFFAPIKNAFAQEGEAKKPKVSVIIPVYNVERDLDKSLKTIENQTFKDIEIICVNDGSKDNSLEILKNHAQKDSRIRIMDQKNQGAGAARNSGLKAAQGEYIYFCDGDDYVLPHALEKAMKIFSKYKNLDAVQFGVSRVGYDERVNLGDYIYNEKNSPKLLECKKGQNPFEVFKTYGWGVWKYVYRKSFLVDNGLEFKKDLRTNEDILFGFLAMSRMKRIVRDKNIGYIYRINRPGSVTDSALKIKLNSFSKIVHEIIKNRKNFHFSGSDEYILNFMLGHVVWRVQKVSDKEDFAKVFYHELWDNFVSKYGVKLSSRNAERLRQLKVWANV